VLLRVEELDAGMAPLTEESSIVQDPAPASIPPPASADAWSAAGVAAPAGSAATLAPATGPAQEAPVVRRRPRAPSRGAQDAKRKRRGLRRTGAAAIVLAVLALIGAGAYIALQSVYFIGTNDRGLVTVFRGVPYRLPGSRALYSSDYVSGVGASTLAPQRRQKLLDHSLRSEANAASLIRSLELGQLE
jgi:hypothetical protein